MLRNIIRYYLILIRSLNKNTMINTDEHKCPCLTMPLIIIN